MEQGAEPLVLVPGMASDARVFADILGPLSADRAVQIAPVTQHPSVSDIAEALLADAPPRFALAGHGLGGAVAMEALRRAPERVSRFAILCADCLPDTPQVAAVREELIVTARAGRLGEAVRAAIRADCLAPGPSRAEVLQRMIAMAMSLGPDAFVRQIRALQRRADQQRTLRAMRAPALVLGGRHDGIAPVRRQEFMATLIPGAKLCILEDAGHLPMLEAPEATAQALRGWLDATAPLILRRSRA